ncbi:cytochrome d ubiquinol oxidase subunit II, partial [Porphyromonas gulae]
LNLWNVVLGLAVFFLARVSALLYFINNIDDDSLYTAARRRLWANTIAFLVFFLAYIAFLMNTNGFAVDPVSKEVYMEPYKYLYNFLDMPAVLAVFLLGVVLVLAGIGFTLLRKGFKRGIWLHGTGTVLTVLALLLIAGWNDTSWYPSTYDLQSSLTIENASSSHFTLEVMSYVSLLIPFVLAYIFYAWRALDIRKITKKEMEHDDHTY